VGGCVALTRRHCAADGVVNPEYVIKVPKARAPGNLQVDDQVGVFTFVDHLGLSWCVLTCC
jgi:hypothetical protein